MRWLRLMAKDARVLSRHRALLAALLAYPFLLALVLGAAFADPPTRLDLAVVNGDADGATFEVGGERIGSEDLVLRLSTFAEVLEPGDEDAALSLLREGRVDAVLVVPPNFVRDVTLLGQNATLRVIVDESDPVRAQVARNAVGGAVDAFLEDVIQKKIEDVLDLLVLTTEGGTTRIAFTDIRILGIQGARTLLTEVLENVEPASSDARKLRDVIGFLDFAANMLGNADGYLRTTALPVEVQHAGLLGQPTRLVAAALPGALVLGIFWTGALASALLVARDVETGVRRRLAAAPTPRWMMALSKAVVALLAALLPAAALLALGVLVLDVPIASLPLTFLALLLSSLAAAALGGVCATLARGTSAAALLVVLLLLPMLLLGGLFYPVAYMPEVTQQAARMLPLTLATDALRGAMLRASTMSELAPPLLGLAAFAALAGFVAALLARRLR